MLDLNGRIAHRISQAKQAAISLHHKLSGDERMLIDKQLDMAVNSTLPSTKHASILTVEIVLRRYGAAL